MVAVVLTAGMIIEKLPLRSVKYFLSPILISAPESSSPVTLSITLPEMILVVVLSFSFEIGFSPAFDDRIQMKKLAIRNMFFILRLQK